MVRPPQGPGASAVVARDERRPALRPVEAPSLEEDHGVSWTARRDERHNNPEEGKIYVSALQDDYLLCQLFSTIAHPTTGKAG